MNAPITHIKIDSRLVLRERAAARALLYREGYLDLHDAVDVLAHDAERDGIDVDEAQAILAAAFRAART